MCLCMKKVVLTYGKVTKENPDSLSVDERNLLSVAYKNVIGARRASWRTLSAESADENGLIKEYQKEVEGELSRICKEVINLIKDELINEEENQKIDEDGYQGELEALKGDEKTKLQNKINSIGEAQVFYLKMAGDYYRYLSEAVQGEDNKNEKDSAAFYKQAFNLSRKVLEPTHPIRLGLALNYSVCFYEILKDKKQACQLAKDAFDEAISKLDKLEESDYKDSTLIMQLLRDNLTLWTSTDVEPEETRDNNPPGYTYKSNKGEVENNGGD